ncbi:hypothetical protein ACHAXT_009062 [Thalassiosira profunda]
MDKAALVRATESSAAPTPGYLYNDIAKTLTSPQTCADTLSFLVNRLSKNNPHTKKKSLKVLAKIVGHPASRGTMKRCVAQTPGAVGAIKEAMAHRGKMDAVTGDQWNVEVREAAKECLEAVYSDAGDGGGGGMPGGGQLQGGGMAGLGSNSAAMSAGYGGQGGGGYGAPGGGGGGYGAPMGGASGSGYAPNSHSGGYGPSSASSSGGRMEGIGNPMFADPRLAQTQQAASKMGQLGEMAKDVGGAMLEMIKDPLAKNASGGVPGPGGGGAGGMPGYGGPSARPDPYAQPPGRSNLALQTGGQWTMASNRGPNAVGSAGNAVMPPPASSEPSAYDRARQGGPAFGWAAAGGGAPPPAAAAPPAPTGVGGSWAGAPAAPPPPPQQYGGPASVASQARQPPAAHAASAVPAGGGYGSSTGAASSGGAYEKNLIAELCPPGGMKAEPPADKLAEFAAAVPSLDPDLVCPALLDALEEGNPWIMRAKALCVIETVLTAEAARGDGHAYADFFHACADEIAPLADHARASVRGPAKRVLDALGVEGGAAATNGAGAAVAAAPTNLLDFDAPAAPAVAAPVAEAVAPTAPAGDSLFSGLNTKAAAPTAAAPAPPAAPPATQDDLLGGLGSGPSVDPPAPAAAAPVAANGTAPGGDLFGNMNVKSEGVAEAAPAPAPPPPAGAAPPAAPGSAFGFLNAAPASPGAPPAPAQTPASPAAKSFDPLLSMGAGGGPTVSPGNAPVSPTPGQMAQMQQMQMAYQQNMMMMQQQMAQMQMASQQMANNYPRQGGTPGMGGMPPMPLQGTPGTPTAAKPPVMGANYMRQVPGVAGDKMSSFSFLGSEPKKQETRAFDFVQDQVKDEKK